LDPAEVRDIFAFTGRTIPDAQWRKALGMQMLLEI
jgi:hypothetical protein